MKKIDYQIIKKNGDQVDKAILNILYKHEKNIKKFKLLCNVANKFTLELCFLGLCTCSLLYIYNMIMQMKLKNEFDSDLEIIKQRLENMENK